MAHIWSLSGSQDREEGVKRNNPNRCHNERHSHELLKVGTKAEQVSANEKRWIVKKQRDNTREGCVAGSDWKEHEEASQ